MEQSAKGAHSITAKVVASYFESDGELSITIGFNDLYDLFNIDSLDVGLLRSWTLRMKQQANQMQNNVGFLDPQVFSATMLQLQTKEVTQAITKAMKHDFVVGAYNTGGHWIVVTIAIKWDVVLYLDSAKTWPKQKFKDVIIVVN